MTNFFNVDIGTIFAIGTFLLALLIYAKLPSRRDNERDSNVLEAQKQAWDMQDKRLSELIEMLRESQGVLQKSVTEGQKGQNERLSAFALQNETSLEAIRNSVAKSLRQMQEDNNTRLEDMRKTVDEKLQKTLEERLGQSFKVVSEQLEAVYKGLGEMQNLAVGVGDLKRVMTGVKARGIWGEYQLEAILEQILSKEQYEKNAHTKKGSREVVEFAIILPADDNSNILLPIDSKFPLDTYDNLIKASESGDAAAVQTAQKALIATIKNEAKNIRDKYINPPNTTDFALMFLPTEALYAEVVKLGLLSVLQNDYKVNITGPSTIAAFLNSLQMGFKTLAIQKRSAEVWNVLASVKGEFEKFATTLEKARERISQTDRELEALVGTRTRMINSKLRNVESLTQGISPQSLESGDNFGIDM